MAIWLYLIDSFFWQMAHQCCELTDVITCTGYAAESRSTASVCWCWWRYKICRHWKVRIRADQAWTHIQGRHLHYQ